MTFRLLEWIYHSITFKTVVTHPKIMDMLISLGPACPWSWHIKTLANNTLKVHIHLCHLYQHKNPVFCFNTLTWTLPPTKKTIPQTKSIRSLFSLNQNLGGGFKDFLFSPLFGEDSHFDVHIFQRGWNHQLEKQNHPVLGPHFVRFDFGTQGEKFAFWPDGGCLIAGTDSQRVIAEDYEVISGGWIGFPKTGLSAEKKLGSLGI